MAIPFLRMYRNKRIWVALAILTLVSFSLMMTTSCWPRVTSGAEITTRTQTRADDRTPDSAWKGAMRMEILKQSVARLASMHKNRRFDYLDGLNTECSSYERQVRIPKTIMTNIWQTSTSYDADDVAIVTQTSQNRIERIERLLTHWPGPVSVAISVDLNDQETFFQKILSCPSVFARQNLDFHMVVKEGEYYPVNLMRNVAFNNTRAAFVLILDVDLVPSYNMYDVMKNASRSLRGEKKALIPAAFEFHESTNTTEYPRNKAALIRLWDKGHLRDFRMGQSQTNYKRWREATKQYVVTYKSTYEPYMMLQHNITPAFNERLIGRFYNKISHVRHVHTLEFELTVLPEVFLVYYPHVLVRRTRTNMRQVILSPPNF